MALALAGAQPAGAEEIGLFNGKDLQGWQFVSVPESSGEGAEVSNGAIQLSASPAGYLQTNQSYQDFSLTLEWRWLGQPGAPRNGGVLIAANQNGKAWPRSYEIDLSAGMGPAGGALPGWSTGDIWLFEVPLPSLPVETTRIDSERNVGQTPRLIRLGNAERDFGRWNRLHIDAAQGQITVRLNGRLVNRISGAGDLAGRIGLQSTAGTIEYRKLRLKPRR